MNPVSEASHLQSSVFLKKYHRTIMWPFLLFCHLLTGQLQAQSRSSVKIAGTITDRSNGRPLPLADVFLSGTTQACKTDEKGFFSIENILPGSYHLVVSLTGYEVYSTGVRITKPIEGDIRIPLREARVRPLDISDSKLRPWEWQKNLDQFEKLFFGPTRNASKCEILNPEVLTFQFKPDNEELTASANKPLQIENQALGYRIDLYLQNFLSRGNRIVRYKYQTKFESIPPLDPDQEKEWEKNRLTAYRGSLNHFIVSLTSGHLEEEGYLISHEFRMIIGERDDTFNQITGESLLSPGEFPHEKKLTFSEFLKVIYLNEDAENEYYRDTYASTYASRSSIGQKSWLKMSTFSVTINTLGSINIPNALATYGYMQWEKFAEALPLDYSSTLQSKQEILPPISERIPPSRIDLKYATPVQRNFHFAGFAFCYGKFHAHHKKINSTFGSIPMFHMNLNIEYGRFSGLMTLSYGQKQSIRNTIYIENYNLLRAKHFSDISLKSYNLSIDFLYQINRKGRLRFLAGPGITAAQMIIRGNEMRNLAGGRIYGTEILDDEIAGGVGLEGVLGFHLLFSQFNAQFFIKYQSKVFLAHEYFDYDFTKEAEVPRYHYISDTSGFQFYFGLGFHR